MAERFQTLYKLSENLYSENSPVIIEAGQLLKDNESGRILVQLKFKNITENVISAMKVTVRAYEPNGNETDGVSDFAYLDIGAARDASFGSKTPIFLPSGISRKFTAAITEITFANGKTKRLDASAEWLPLPAPTPIESVLGSKELAEQYKIDVGGNVRNAPTEIGSLRYCACGSINSKDDDVCHNCGRKFDTLVAAMDKETLSEHISKRKAEEKAAEEKRKAAEAEAKAKAEAEAKAEAKAKKRKKKKIIISVLAVLAAVLILVSVIVLINLNSYHYKLNDNKTGYVIEDAPAFLRGDVVIPSTHNGKPVTSIGNWAFDRRNSLTSITIPNSVTSIGGWAFYWCNSLTSITIPDSVTSIGDYAFDWCDSLTSITIPDSVTSIGKGAFWYCRSLTSITIPDSVTSIGDYAFYWCDSLTSITIPNSVTSIGYGAFSGCYSLTSITVEPGNTVYHSAGNCLIETASKTLIAGCKTSVIPSDGSVTSIGDYAFDCRSLTSITIPNSVTSIGGWAFYWCNSLTSITFTGTKAQWNAITKGSNWNANTGNYTIHCTDGDISK